MASRRLQNVVQHVQVFNCVWFLTFIHTTSGAMPCLGKIHEAQSFSQCIRYISTLHTVFFRISMLAKSCCRRRLPTCEAAAQLVPWNMSRPGSVASASVWPASLRPAAATMDNRPRRTSMVCEQILLDANQQLSAR